MTLSVHTFIPKGRVCSTIISLLSLVLLVASYTCTIHHMTNIVYTHLHCIMHIMHVCDSLGKNYCVHCYNAYRCLASILEQELLHVLQSKTGTLPAGTQITVYSICHSLRLTESEVLTFSAAWPPRCEDGRSRGTCWPHSSVFCTPRH